jgi:hypothetical protein
MDARHLDRLILVEWWQQPCRSSRQQRLSYPGRPAEREVVPAGDRDLEGAASDLLADDRAEIGRIVGGGIRNHVRRRRCGPEALDSRQVADRAAQRRRGANDDARHACRLRGVLRRHEGLGRARDPRGRHQGEDAGHGTQAAIERQLAHQGGACQPITGELLGRDQQADGHGHVVHGPFLRQVGRCQVDRDPAWRNLEAGVPHRGPHPLARLEDRAAGEADDGQAGQTERDVHLDPDRDAVDTDDRGAQRRCEHGTPHGGGEGSSSGSYAGRPPARLPTNQRRPARPA